jgi:hypothetical protein
MKLLYTSGQFLFNEKWPEMPQRLSTKNFKDYDDYNAAITSNRIAYESALSQSIKEAVVVEELPDGFYRAVLQSKGVSPDGFIDDLFKEGSFYELPEGWTVKQEYKCLRGCVTGKDCEQYEVIGCDLAKTAKVLPVEEPVTGFIGNIKLSAKVASEAKELAKSVSEGKEDEQEKIWNEIYDEILWYGVESSELMKRYHITRKSLPSK